MKTEGKIQEVEKQVQLCWGRGSGEGRPSNSLPSFLMSPGRGRGRGGARLVLFLGLWEVSVVSGGSVEGAEVPLQVLRLVVVGEEVVLIDVVLVVVLVPLGDILFIVLVVLVLCLLAALLACVVVVIRVSRVRRSLRLGPENKNVQSGSRQ